MDERIRVATLQYLIRPIETFEQFAAQVTGLVETAADYKCRLVLFPEYFTLQLLTLGDVRAPIREQVKRLSGFVPRYVELFSELSRKHGRYLCAGTIPVAENGDIYNTCFFFGPDGAGSTTVQLTPDQFSDLSYLEQALSDLGG